MPHAFAEHLEKYGPHRARHALPIGLGRARRYCRHFLKASYENFTVASLLLPRHLREPFAAVYAYCRWADDLADETGGGQLALDLLEWWRNELRACYAGRAWHPVMVALRPVVREFGIPMKPFADLIFAFEQDQLVKNYNTQEQLLEYCSYSANPVGHIVLHLFGAFDPVNAELSDHVCTGLQLANFWQDIKRDKDIGRVYLPERERYRFNYSDGEFHKGEYNRAWFTLMRHQVNYARDRLHRGWPLVERVPSECAIDVELFIRGGLAILQKIEAAHYHVMARRPTVGKLSKAALLLSAVARRWLVPPQRTQAGGVS